MPAGSSTRRTRSRRLQHWLLLRCASSLSPRWCWRFARPLVRGQWLASHDRREVVLVIDNSLSTGKRSQSAAGSEPEIVFDEAAAAADEIVTDFRSAVPFAC